PSASWGGRAGGGGAGAGGGGPGGGGGGRRRGANHGGDLALGIEVLTRDAGHVLGLHLHDVVVVLAVGLPALAVGLVEGQRRRDGALALQADGVGAHQVPLGPGQLLGGDPLVHHRAQLVVDRLQ